MERRFDRGFRNFSPVKVGEELEVKIEAVGEKGDGIAKKDGFVLFVPGAKEGDTVRIRVTKVLRKVGFAEIVGQGSGSAGGSKEEPAEEEAPKDSENFGEEEAPKPSEEEEEQDYSEEESSGDENTE